MFHALNMDLEIVRTILKNDVNEIYVCTDLLNRAGGFYTMISVSSTRHRKLLADKMNNDGLFFGNKDFIGSFVFSNKLNLVFRYYHENLLSTMGGIYLYSFAECKQAALSLIASLAEANVYGDVGMLLLNDRNLNITKEGDMILNYFLDFNELEEGATQEQYMNQVAKSSFAILELNYKEKYQSPEMYPDDLRLYYLKIKTTGLTSFGQMISVIRSMADKPVEMRGFLWWIRSRFVRTKKFLFRNSMTAFLTILVIITVIYAGYQISMRVRASRAMRSNVSYYGIEYIGNVYLGNEE